MTHLRYILLLMLLLPNLAHAQFSFDIPSVEAYIADHKNQRSLLLARATLEQSNALLHDYSKTANVHYKEINVELDKYTGAFDVIKLFLNLTEILLCINISADLADLAEVGGLCDKENSVGNGGRSYGIDV